MVFNRIILEPRREFSWSLDLFWVMCPFTVACGIWDLGGWATLAFYGAIGINLILGCVTVLRLLGYKITIDPQKKVLYSFAQGIAWAAAMLFAWPASWVGPVYGILIFLNFCLLEFKRPKKG